MDKFDLTTVKMLRAEINEALKVIGEKNGLKIELLNSRFDARKVSFNFKCSNRQ